MPTQRMVSGLVLAGLVLGSASDVCPAAGATEDQAAIGAACTYYARRAGPDPRRAPVTFVALLSESCLAAHQSVVSGSPSQRDAATLLLSRIAELYRTVAEMNADRDRAVEGLTGVARILALTRVTPSGEFLIAHRMGVMAAFDAWLDTGADFSLASYR